jgi:methanogenic corrinoid protein MtbC1
VVIAAPAGETHSLPVAMGANLLRWKGFEVIELGADTPPDALAAALPKQGGLLAVGLVCTTAASCQDAAEAIAAVRQSAPETPVLLGGAAISGADHARQLGAGLFTGKRGDGLVRAVEALSRAGRAT